MEANHQHVLLNLLAELEQGKLTGRQAYHAIHELGQQNIRHARSVVESFLTSEDPALRTVALEVLTRHWRLPEHWITARDFLEHDRDVEARMQGASGLEVLKRNTQDPMTLRVLAQVVRDESSERHVREAAYAAMRGVLHYEPKEQFQLASKGADWPRGIDWRLVDSYL